MRVIDGVSIWSLVSQGAIGIPTNGALARNGAGVMGAGLALGAKNRYPGIAYDLGTHLRRCGNVVGWLRQVPDKIIAIPVKPSFMTIRDSGDFVKVLPKVRGLYSVGAVVPGYHCLADIDLIKTSLTLLVRFIESNNLETVYIPLLGCGNGGLSYSKDLCPLLKSMNLPDAIVLVTYRGENEATKD